jgi:hypothetical protein
LHIVDVVGTWWVPTRSGETTKVGLKWSLIMASVSTICEDDC